MRFSQLASIRKVTVQPSKFSAYSIYLGFEHFDPGTLRFNKPGNPSNVTSTKQAFHAGDTLYGKLRPYFRKVGWARDLSGLCSTDLWVFEPKPGVESRFVFYVAGCQAFSDLASSSSEGTRMPRASWSVVKDFEIPDFTLDEQRGIAATLGVLDDKIESNRRLIRLINDLLDSMALLLGSKLPSVALGDLVASSSQTVNPLRLGEQVVDHFSLPAFDSMQTPERIPASEIMSNKLAISEPCILISRLNPRVNRTWLAIPELGYPALASTEFLCVLPKGRVEIGAIWLALRDEFFISELRRRVTGTSGSHQRVRPNDALSIEVPDVRKIDETEKLKATALLEIEHQRKAENQHLSRLRDSLLPELLSGRIRVPEAHETVQEVIA
ncbi:MAG: hypothetical protein M1399_02630 [Actinobacteria bacterium]|nr:hypothetical protein [Actinomycetota bacterium]MCL5446096.1 hypothetical protein [Actinomycetota bacterium]